MCRPDIRGRAIGSPVAQFQIGLGTEQAASRAVAEDDRSAFGRGEPEPTISKRSIIGLHP